VFKGLSDLVWNLLDVDLYSCCRALVTKVSLHVLYASLLADVSRTSATVGWEVRTLCWFLSRLCPKPVQYIGSIVIEPQYAASVWEDKLLLTRGLLTDRHAASPARREAGAATYPGDFLVFNVGETWLARCRRANHLGVPADLS
jgi:hypothetical protein